MRQVIRQRPIVICAISLGLMTAHVSLLQSIPSASAQQLTGPAYQGNSGTGSQGRRIESHDPTLLYPTKSLEKKDTQTLTYKPHRLIRKSQNAPVASVEPSPSSFSAISSLPTPIPSLQDNNTTSQSKEPSSFIRSVGPTVPLATVGVAPTSVTTSGATASGTVSTGTIPLAAPGKGKSSTSGNGNAGGRSMSKLAEEMPGLTQLMSPSSAQVPPTPPPPINPVIGASPISLSFSAQQGGANPAPQTLSISNTGGGTLSWNASPSMAWLSVSSASGTGSGAVTLSVVTGTLTVGTHSGMITLSAPNATTVTVPVTFIVAASPAIGANPTALSFTATAGGANPANQTLSISNTGGGTLSWSASDSATWLTLSPASGTGNGTVTLTATTGTLAANTYTSTVTLSGAAGVTPVTVPVTFTVTAAPVPPAIGASPTALSFTATAGGANPANQTLSISNTGGGTLSWSASDSATWLTLSPASGTGNGTVTLTATTGTLAANTYTSTVTLSGAAGVTPVTVPVTFTVAAAPNITLNPSSLTYAATQGAANPANQTVSLATSGGTLNWTVNDDVTWLTVGPASGSSSSTLTASVNTAGLATGTQTGTITVSATGASSKTIAVTLTVSAPTTSSATLTWTPNTDTDLAGYKIYRATTSGAYGAALATIPMGTLSYQATGLLMNTTYFFVITAYDSAGNESSFSNEVSKSIF